MKDSHRVDSLILALEEALERKVPSELFDAELVVLTVEAMEREVNNGGYEQFFLNSPEFVPKIVRALELIQCPVTAKITADAIAALQLPAQVNPAAVEHATSVLSAQSKTKLAECDSRYFAKEENIEQRLFAYIEEHHQEIRIP